MAVRSRRLYGPTALGFPTTTTVYTVPADRTLILRTITVVNQTGAVTGTFRMGINSTSANARIIDALPVAGGEHVWLDTWIALNPGDFLVAVSVSASLRLALFGTLLFGAPE